MKIDINEFSEMSVEEIIFFGKREGYKLSEIKDYIKQLSFDNKKNVLQPLSYAI